MFLKIFKSNLSNCVLCFISSILVSAMVFLFEGIKVLILGSLDEYDRVHSEVGMAAQTYIFVLLLIGIVLILYTVNNYSRVRIRDYSMFMVLGSTKRQIIRMVLAEYGMICGISYLIGCAAGAALLVLLQRVFQAREIAAGLTAASFAGIAGASFLYMLLIFAAAVALNLISLQNHSLSSLMSFQEKKSRIPSLKRSVIGVLAGAACVALAALNIRPPLDYRKLQYAFFFFLCAVYLFFTYLGSLVLAFLKKREGWYGRHLLKIKNLYYRFAENKNFMFVVFVVNFFVFSFVNTGIVEYSGTDSRYLWKYPYDYVWLTEGKYTDTIREASQGVENETRTCPYVKGMSRDEREFIGISESSYQDFTGKELGLAPGEFVSLIEKAEWDEDVMFPIGSVYLRQGDEVKPFEVKDDGMKFCSWRSRRS